MKPGIREEALDKLNEIISQLGGQSVQEIEASMPELGDTPKPGGEEVDLPGSGEFAED